MAKSAGRRYLGIGEFVQAGECPLQKERLNNTLAICRTRYSTSKYSPVSKKPRPDTKSYVRPEEEICRFLKTSVAASLRARAHKESAFVLAGRALAFDDSTSRRVEVTDIF